MVAKQTQRKYGMRRYAAVLLTTLNHFMVSKIRARRNKMTKSAQKGFLNPKNTTLHNALNNS